MGEGGGAGKEYLFVLLILVVMDMCSWLFRRIFQSARWKYKLVTHIAKFMIFLRY